MNHEAVAAEAGALADQGATNVARGASLYCPHCHRHTSVETALVKVEDAYGQNSYVVAVWVQSHISKWWIGVCNYCDHPVLVQNNAVTVYPHPPTPTGGRGPEPTMEECLPAE